MSKSSFSFKSSVQLIHYQYQCYSPDSFSPNPIDSKLSHFDAVCLSFFFDFTGTCFFRLLLRWYCSSIVREVNATVFSFINFISV